MVEVERGGGRGGHDGVGGVGVEKGARNEGLRF